MENQSPSKNRIHPLVAAAAVGVLLFSLVGVAAMTGLLPNSNSSTNPDQETAAIDKTGQKTAEAPKARETVKKAESPRPVACLDCGRVEAVHAVQTAAQPSGVGVVGGAVVGGLLGNQIGGGSGRTLATVAGAVGGGYAGNEIEKRTRTATTYQVRVRMEDGKIRNFPYNNQPPWREGDHVRVVDGYLRAG